MGILFVRETPATLPSALRRVLKEIDHLHVVRALGRERSVDARREPRELAKFPRPMRLVAIARHARNAGEGSAFARPHRLERSLKAENPRVELRREADRMAEERNEVPMAVAAVRNDIG